MHSNYYFKNKVISTNTFLVFRETLEVYCVNLVVAMHTSGMYVHTGADMVATNGVNKSTLETFICHLSEIDYFTYNISFVQKQSWKSCKGNLEKENLQRICYKVWVMLENIRCKDFFRIRIPIRRPTWEMTTTM